MMLKRDANIETQPAPVKVSRSLLIAELHGVTRSLVLSLGSHEFAHRPGASGPPRGFVAGGFRSARSVPAAPRARRLPAVGARVDRVRVRAPAPMPAPPRRPAAASRAPMRRRIICWRRRSRGVGWPGSSSARIDDRRGEQRRLLRRRDPPPTCGSTCAPPPRRRRCRRPTRSRSDTARGSAASTAPPRAGARSAARAPCGSDSSTATDRGSWRAAA